MPKARNRTYSSTSKNAASLLGASIRSARIQRRMTAVELAERAGVSRGLVRRVENGDMEAAIGPAFEMAAILGIPLFDPDAGQLARSLHHVRSINALLPSRAVPPRTDPDDDF